MITDIAHQMVALHDSGVLYNNLRLNNVIVDALHHFQLFSVNNSIALFDMTEAVVDPFSRDDRRTSWRLAPSFESFTSTWCESISLLNPEIQELYLKEMDSPSLAKDALDFGIVWWELDVKRRSQIKAVREATWIDG